MSVQDQQQPAPSSTTAPVHPSSVVPPAQGVVPGMTPLPTAGTAVLPQGFSPQPTASLYVGELDPSVTEAFLFEMFNVIGPVASVRVCRDAVTRRSLGYSYVNFHHQADGERAVEQLNYTPIKGRICRIMWSQRDPSLRRSGSGNIFIKNLDSSIDNKALHDTFAAFGRILSCKVAARDGQPLGYGFVHYETREAAEAAIAAVNGMLLNDKEVFVGFHVPKREREAEIAIQRSKFTNLYVKNVPQDLSDAEFTAMFEEFGPTLSAIVQRDEDGGSRGFGFVSYNSHEEAQAALEALNNKEINGTTLYVARAQKKYEREEELRRQYEAARQERMQKYQGSNVYIKNLNDDVEDDQLRVEFTPFGIITSAKVMRDEKGQSRGFGFVCYSTPEEATAAVTEMNGKMVWNKPLYVALAQRKDQRRAQLEAHHAQRAHMVVHGGYRMPTGNAPAMPMGMPPAMYMAPPGGGYYQQGNPMQGPQNGHRNGPYLYQQPNQSNRQRMGPPMHNGVVHPGMYAYPGMPMGPNGNQPPMPMGGGGVMRGSGRGGRGGMRGGAPNRSHRGSAMIGQGNSPMVYNEHVQQQGFKYTSSGRYGSEGMDNSGMGQAMMNMPNPVQHQGGGGGSSLSAATLAAATPMEQKQLLGETLFPLISQREPELAPKITGMLLEMETAEVLHLLESPDDLFARVDEASDLLRQVRISDD